MKVLAVTNMYPTDASPAHGTFVQSQVESLKPLVDIEVLHIDRALQGRSAYFSVRRQVSQAISTANPDIVHVMNGGALSFFTATTVGRTPLVISFCGSDLLGDPQVSWKRRSMGRITVLASKAAALRADAIIAKSKQLAAQVPAAVPAEKVHVIPNGVDFNQFRPLDKRECQSRLGWNPDEFQVLFTGNPDSETKRFTDAAGAVECIRARGIPARLQLMRGVRHEQVPLWLNAADVLLLCSVHEGSPNIVKESLACECPVVSTDVGDVTERLEGITGCYLCNRTVESLADGLEAVHRQGARLRCRSQIAPISTDAIAKRVESVYRDIAKLGKCARKELKTQSRSA